MSKLPLTIELPGGRAYLRLWEVESPLKCVQCGLELTASRHKSAPTICWRIMGWENHGEAYCQRCTVAYLRNLKTHWDYDSVLHRLHPEPEGVLIPEQFLSTPFTFGGKTCYFRLVTLADNPVMSITRPDGITNYYTRGALLNCSRELTTLPERELYSQAIKYMEEALL